MINLGLISTALLRLFYISPCPGRKSKDSFPEQQLVILSLPVRRICGSQSSWLNQDLIFNQYFNVKFLLHCRTSHKLWTPSKASGKVEERSSYEKPRNIRDDIQVVLQPSSEGIIFFPTLCPIEKRLMSLSSPSC